MHQPGALRCLGHAVAPYNKHSSPAAEQEVLQPSAKGDVLAHPHFNFSHLLSFGTPIDSSTGGDVGQYAAPEAFLWASCSHPNGSGCCRPGGTAGPSWSSGSSSPVADVYDLDIAFEMSPEADAGLASASTDSAASSLQSAADQCIDGALISSTFLQQMQNTASNGVRGGVADCSSYRYSVDGDDSAQRQRAVLGGAAQKCGAPPSVSLGHLSPTVQQMLLALPPEQQHLFSQALTVPWTQQQVLSAMGAGSADDRAAAAGLLRATAEAVSNTNTSCMHNSAACSPSNLLAADATNTAVHRQALQRQLQLQAALAVHQQAASVGQHPCDPTGLSPAGHSLLQLLAAEQQALACHSATQAAPLACSYPLDPLSQSLPVGGCSLAQYYQTVSGSPSTAGHLWPFTAGLSAPASAYSPMAAAAAVLQHNQQQSQLSTLMQAALSGSAAAAAALPYNQLTASVLSSQLAAAAAAAASYTGPLSPMCSAAVASASQPKARALVPSAFKQQQYSTTGASAVPPGGKGSPLGLGGRRNRSGGRSSSGCSIVLPQSCDAATYGKLPSKSGATGSYPATSTASATSQALSAAAFEDYWGSEEAERSSADSQDGPSMGACRSSSSGSSSSEDGTGVCGRRSSVASAGGLLACRRPSSTDSEVFAIDLGPCSREAAACEQISSLSAGDAEVAVVVKGASRDQVPAVTTAAAHRDSCTSSKVAGTVNRMDTGNRDSDSQPGQTADTTTCSGCRVRYPSARESSGDDSWYLSLPPTCRLFVGNIGCWVDEALLLSYFGKYGKVMDVQVMWNTKMLARGRRVNREFAFISYSTPLEAARAVHWLDGCSLVDVEKDKNGITVEYENGESDASPAAARSAASTKPAKS